MLAAAFKAHVGVIRNSPQCRLEDNKGTPFQRPRQGPQGRNEPGVALESSLILVRALVVAPAPVIAPFTSSQFIRALLAGYFVFGDLPDLWMLLGCTVIVASGLFVFHREAVLGER